MPKLEKSRRYGMAYWGTPWVVVVKTGNQQDVAASPAHPLLRDGQAAIERPVLAR